MKQVFAWPIWVLIMAVLALHPKRTSLRKAGETVGKWLRLARKKQGDSIYNIYLKTMESYHFATHVPEEPSLEFGGNWGNFTNDIYTGSCRITYSSEYLGESFFSGDAPHPNRHDVFDSLFLSEAHRLPIPGGTLSTVISMHILDHIIKTDDLFSEISRSLRSGGHLYATTYGRDIWLPEFPVLKLFGLLGERYRNWRLSHRPEFSIGGTMA